MAGASMEKIIKAAVERGASDLHIKPGDVFRARIDGKLVPLTKQRLTPDQTRAIAQRLVGGEDSAKRLETLRDFDCSWGLPGVGRFRINILRQRSSFMIVMRVIPFTVPSLESLALPVSLQAIAESDRGLVLVAGMSGSGKSSTVAALVNHINHQQQRHIVIIEDPIEFLHRDLNSSITQREVGVDTDSTEVGLRAALRQDPDVIVLGDLRDANAVNLAIKAAEAGRLVIAVMPSPGAVATVGQVHAILPEDEREIGRSRFAAALRAIVAQQLVPRADGNGRVAVVELLVPTPAIREALREPARLGELQRLMDSGEGDVMTFASHARSLAEAGVITAETARAVEGH
jgi:twitching motility protein PilT